MVRFLVGAFLIWLIMRSRLGTYQALMIVDPNSDEAKFQSKPDDAIGNDWLYLFRRNSAQKPSATKKPDVVNV